MKEFGSAQPARDAQACQPHDSSSSVPPLYTQNSGSIHTPEEDLMNIRSNITLWRSGRTCAFLAAGLTILSTVIRLWRLLIIQWDLPYPFQPALTHLGFVGRLTFMRSMRPDLESTLQTLIAQMRLLLLVLVFGVAVDATALGMAGRRQQPVAPVGSRLFRWAVATYVAAMMLTLALARRALLSCITPQRPFLGADLTRTIS
jgi:hypothetical protein